MKPILRIPHAGAVHSHWIYQFLCMDWLGDRARLPDTEVCIRRVAAAAYLSITWVVAFRWERIKRAADVASPAAMASAIALCSFSSVSDEVSLR